MYMGLHALLVMVLIAGSSVDLGTYGKTYPVKETPPHILIQEKLKNFKMPPRESLIYIKDIDIPKAEVTRKRLLDPTYATDVDIKDNKGNIIVKKGTTVNPQEFSPLKRRFLFINPDNEDEIEMAAKASNDIVIEIVKGNPDEVNKLVGRRVFKANELILNRFGVKVTPSLVRGNGKLIEITEFGPSDPNINK